MIQAILFGIHAVHRKKNALHNNNHRIKLEKRSKASMNMECPSSGSDSTPPHTFPNFYFEEFAPPIFQSLRVHFGIESASCR